MINILYDFTYKDYITYIHNIRQTDYLNVKEETEIYSIVQEKYIEKQYQCMIEYLFKDKERICYFINHFSNNQKILVKENLEYIEFYKEKEGIKIIYKNANKQTFYIILYQQEIYLNLPYMILKDCIYIFQKYKPKTMKKIHIIPIVIYVTESKYLCCKMNHPYFKMTTYDNHILELKYNVINLVNFIKEQKNRNTFLEDLLYVENLKDFS